MALDDHVKALDLNVDTVGTVVTVSGIVNNEAERDRALHLARDTAGVTQVVDKLQIRRYPLGRGRLQPASPLSPNPFAPPFVQAHAWTD